MREKAPRNERPQRRSAAPGSAGGVGVYWGEWSPSGDFLLSFPPGPFFLTAAGAAFHRDVPRLHQVQFLSPARCLLSSGAGGFSGRPAENHSLPVPGNYRFFPRHGLSPEKPSYAVPCLFSLGAGSWELRSPGNTSRG